MKIKFRQPIRNRDGSFKEWFYWGDIDEKEWRDPATHLNGQETRRESQMFTGKQDCKGVDVYDGDIIDFDKNEWGGDGNIHLVEWNDHDAEWSFGGGTTSDMEWRTVIGNVYETPNLIPQ